MTNFVTQEQLKRDLDHRFDEHSNEALTVSAIAGLAVIIASSATASIVTLLLTGRI